MIFTLRPYQEEASRRGIEHLKKPGKNSILQLATGAGKSIIIADICLKLDAPVLVLQPTKELLEQNFAKLVSFLPSAREKQQDWDGRTMQPLELAVYSASMNSKKIAKYTYATIGSIYKKPQLFNHFKYVIVDECDVVQPKALTGMYQKFFDGIGCKNVLGLTATPYRMDNKYVYENGELFASATLRMISRIGRPRFWAGGIAFKIETKELIDAGYLAPIKYRVDSEDLRSLIINSRGTDYTEESLEAWGVSKISSIVNYIKWVHPKCQRNLVFCTSVKQAQGLRDALYLENIGSAIVTAETPPRLREEHIRDFREGRIKHMLNVGVFLAGFDVPELDCIIYARPTLSPRIWYQAVGRGLRKDPARPEKVLRVFDLAGQLRKIGAVEQIRLGLDDNGRDDALYGTHGRLDEQTLYKFKITRKG